MKCREAASKEESEGDGQGNKWREDERAREESRGEERKGKREQKKKEENISQKERPRMS